MRVEADNRRLSQPYIAMSSWEPSVPELWMSRAALCEAAEDGDADKITRMLSGTDPKGAAMRLPHGELVPSFEDTFYEF